MRIRLKRVYAAAGSRDGTRILVDRVWPRGVKREESAIDVWLKEIAPSNELRRWFKHDPEKWEEFKRRYYCELNRNEEAVRRLAELACQGMVTLVFGAKNEHFNNAAALKKYMEERCASLERVNTAGIVP